MSSNLTPFRLRLTARQGGLDPTTHYWYRVGHRTYRRICDDALWGGGARYENPPNVDCIDCSLMLHDDRRDGHRAFTVTRAPKGFLAPRHGDVLYNQVDRFNSKVAGAMEPIPMWQFIDYCCSTGEGREQIVRQYLHIESNTAGGPDPFRPLRDAFMQLDGTVESLRANPPQPVSGFHSKYADAYAAITGTMIAYCDRREAQPYGALPTQVTVGKASVCVEAEFWMVTDSGNGTVRLWLRNAPMPSSRADVVGFLLDEARLTQAFWVGRIPYVWPIRKVNAPQQRSPSNEVQRKCTQAGEDFMERCSRWQSNTNCHSLLPTTRNSTLPRI